MDQIIYVIKKNGRIIEAHQNYKKALDAAIDLMEMMRKQLHVSVKEGNNLDTARISVHRPPVLTVEPLQVKS